MANPRSTVFIAGMEEGRQQVRTATIAFLEERILTNVETRPDRGSPEYQFAHELIRDLIKHVDTVELV